MTTIPLKRAGTFRNDVLAATRPMLALEHLDNWTGLLLKDAVLGTAEVGQPGVAAVEGGDVLFGKLRPYLAKGVTVTQPLAASTELICIRPNADTDPRYLGYVTRSVPFVQWSVASSEGTKMPRTSWEKLGDYELFRPPLAEQRAIADYLDAETARIDALIAKKQQLIHLLEERANAEIMVVVGRSELAGGSEIEVRPIRKLCLRKQDWVEQGEIITAFRDGQVTTRSLRGRDGFTNSWTEGARLQVVKSGDVVVHGLDGFSGAIGESEADGVCSPVYHVIDSQEGDAAFLGRMLRLLAVNGYLSNFATSTRERAVDFRNWELFGGIPVPEVDPRVQRRVGERIRAIRPFRSMVQESERLALEKRQALITSAVTGELEIEAPR